MIENLNLNDNDDKINNINIKNLDDNKVKNSEKAFDINSISENDHSYFKIPLKERLIKKLNYPKPNKRKHDYSSSNSIEKNKKIAKSKDKGCKEKISQIK